MKKSIIYFLIFSSSILKINAQEISDNENSLLDNFIKAKISITKEKIVSDILAKALTGTFFKVDAGFLLGDGGIYSGLIFVLKDENLLEYVGRTDSLNTLLSLVRKDFYLKTEADAKIFETSLDKLFPISWTTEDEKEHLKIKNQWYFIRGKFFDSKSGYIVTLDKNSNISDIAYRVEAIKK